MVLVSWFRPDLCQDGYPIWLLKQAQQKALNRDRPSRLQEKWVKLGREDQTKPIVFSTAYSAEYTTICTIVKKYMPLLENDMGTETALKNGSLCVARRAPTLRQELSPSLYSDNLPNKPTWLQYKGSYPCGHKICICCTVMKVSDHVRSHSNGSSFAIKQYINCNSRKHYLSDFLHKMRNTICGAYLSDT